MFSYDTDLTLDSVMVGKNTTMNRELFHDNSFYDTYLYPKQKLINLPNGKQVVDEPTDHNNIKLLYNLFGDFNERLQVYRFFQEYAMGIVSNCECCGADLNIFNRTPYTICKKCDTVDSIDYETQMELLNV